MPSSPPPAAPTVTLLFCHGAGFCRDIWTPIITRLERSSLLRHVRAAGGRIDIVAFDLPYHGTNRDVSVAPVLHLEDASAPRVSHPAMEWPVWSMAAVRRQLEELKSQQRGECVIGIGHSMGAAAMWGVEARNPGTFAGLVLFEPMCLLNEFPNRDAVANVFVAALLERTAKWNSREEAEKETASLRAFKRWHPESLRAFLDGAIVRVTRENNEVDSDAAFALACPPVIEASFYCSDLLRLSPDDVARVACRITFHYGARTMLFFPHLRQPLVDKYPHLYGIGAPVPKATHAMVMEDPDTVVQRIVGSLAELPPFSVVSTSSRL